MVVTKSKIKLVIELKHYKMNLSQHFLKNKVKTKLSFLIILKLALVNVSRVKGYKHQNRLLQYMLFKINIMQLTGLPHNKPNIYLGFWINFRKY